MKTATATYGLLIPLSIGAANLSAQKSIPVNIQERYHKQLDLQSVVCFE
jgi:hypothetical protein